MLHTEKVALNVPVAQPRLIQREFGNSFEYEEFR